MLDSAIAAPLKHCLKPMWNLEIYDTIEMGMNDDNLIISYNFIYY